MSARLAVHRIASTLPHRVLPQAKPNANIIMPKRASSSSSPTATTSTTTAASKKKRTQSKASPSPPTQPSLASNTGTAPIQVARLSATHPEWPAPASRMQEATSFLLACASSPSSERILIVPDKDADGLCSGVILYRTLTHALGIDPSRIDVHLMSKGDNPSSPAQRTAMAEYGAKWIIVLDQGSRNGPSLVPGAEHGWRSEREDSAKSMVVDHHWLERGSEGPEGCLMLNACHHEPVATASLLTWVLCRPLWQHPETQNRRSDRAGAGETSEDAKGERDAAEKLIDYVAVLGTMGDLSVNVSWSAPFPDLTPEVKKWTKKRLGSAIALLNAPRRTPQFDVITAWSCLLASTSPLSILDPSSSSTGAYSSRLYQARDAVALETERCTHTPPKFSKDGRIALLRITSPYQVHPSIATRWTGALKSKHLQVVMCANDGYNPGLVNFSCRIAQVAKTRGEDVNIIHILNSFADRDAQWKQDVVKDVGGNAFNGHIQASGGIFPAHHFEKFVQLMEIGVPPDNGSSRGGSGKGGKKGNNKLPAQKNNLLSMGFSTSSKTAKPASPTNS